MNDLESRFTKPSEFCPHPEYWHSPDEETTEVEVTNLIAALVTAIQPEFVLETGTAHGYTSFAIGNALKLNGHGRLVSLDNDGWMIQDASNLVGSDLPVEILNINSMEYTPPEDIDFAFFDSWQTGRHQEFLRYLDMDKIKEGTIVAFHDTAPHHQVLQYIKKLEADGYIKAIYLKNPRGLAIAEVI